jgi:archaellum component FlaF (FlaF/FlaG flagellin family)
MIPDEMGIEISASYAVLAFALFICVGLMYGSVSNATERITNSLEDERGQSDTFRQMDITITGADYAAGTLRVSVKNTGTAELSISATDILVDGRYITDGSRDSTIVGENTTDVWASGETLELRVDLPPPEYVKIVTEYGVAARIPVDVFRQTANVAFTDDSDSLRSYGFDGRYTNYPGTASAVGPPISNFVTQNAKELPSVSSSGNVTVATETGDRIVLASDARAGFTRLSVGRWQGTAPSIFYVNATSHIIRVTSNGTTTPIDANSEIEAQGVAGTGDIDGDDSAELIYGGNGPSGTSNSIVYIDDDGTVVGTGVGYGTNNGIALGEPADFDGDGVVRVPYVDGSNNINLAGENGTTTALTSGGAAAKAPVATGNFDGDDPLEIYFVGANSGELEVLDNATRDNTIRTITDDQGNTTTIDNDAGAA